MLHFLAGVGACNLLLHAMLCSVDSCQSKVSADQFKMSVLRAQVMYFLEIYRWQVSSFQLIAGSTLIGFLYCNIFSLPGASPLASAKSVKNLLDDPNSFRRTNWARRRTFHELNSLSLVRLMKSSYFSLGLSENSRGYFIFKITGLVGQFWLVVSGFKTACSWEWTLLGECYSCVVLTTKLTFYL